MNYEFCNTVILLEFIKNVERLSAQPRPHDHQLYIRMSADLLYIRPHSLSLSSSFFQDQGVKEDELQSILNYLLTTHEVHVTSCYESVHRR